MAHSGRGRMREVDIHGVRRTSSARGLRQAGRRLLLLVGSRRRGRACTHRGERLHMVLLGVRPVLHGVVHLRHLAQLLRLSYLHALVPRAVVRRELQCEF